MCRQSQVVIFRDKGTEIKLYSDASQSKNNPNNQIDFIIYNDNDNFGRKKEMLIIMKEIKIVVSSNRLDLFAGTNR